MKVDSNVISAQSWTFVSTMGGIHSDGDWLYCAISSHCVFQVISVPCVDIFEKCLGWQTMGPRRFIAIVIQLLLQICLHKMCAYNGFPYFGWLGNNDWIWFGQQWTQFLWNFDYFTLYKQNGINTVCCRHFFVTSSVKFSFNVCTNYLQKCVFKEVHNFTWFNYPLAFKEKQLFNVDI